MLGELGSVRTLDKAFILCLIVSHYQYNHSYNSTTTNAE